MTSSPPLLSGPNPDFGFPFPSRRKLDYDYADDHHKEQAVILNLIFGSLAALSLALALWQWLAARRFPLHQRVAAPSSPPDPHRSRREEALTSSPQLSTLNSQPPLTLLKPLKGCDPATEDCLRSWFAQQYTGPIQILFGVAAADDPVCGLVRKLVQEFPCSDAQLVTGPPPPGANAKVAKLVELERLAKHDLLVISDADVRVPPDFLANIVAPLCVVPPPLNLVGTQTCGLVCCFYRLANPATLAMQWEAVAINADFWSQVLQSRSLKPIDFALGAVMATRRRQLDEIGGFAGLVDCLADDYQLGNRIARRGHSIALSPVVVECWSAPMGWADVWKHQLRWARTIRVCQPAPYFFSLLSNATLWPLLWLIVCPGAAALVCALFCWLVRILTALDLQQRLNYPPAGRRVSPRAPSPAAMQPSSPAPWRYAWLAPVKDLLQAAIWLLAFMGNRIEWRGQRMRLRRDGTLVRG
jgi:ceramide glucosyltransferase